MNSETLEKYWNDVALETKNAEAFRVMSWRRAARNWLAEYADKRADDFVSDVVENVVKLKGSAKVLDLGCGPGKWTTFYAKKCSDVTAIDFSPEMVRLAKESAVKQNLDNVIFHVMNVSDLTLPSDVYDLVNCVTVLQHILDDDEWKLAVRGIVRVTKPGGTILLFETAPQLAIKKRTPHVRMTTMKHYVREFAKHEAELFFWRAVDLSLPITFYGLKNYAASFNRKVYYFFAGRIFQASVDALSLFSRISAVLAKPIDYRLGRTSLGLLSLGRIMVFRKHY